MSKEIHRTTDGRYVAARWNPAGQQFTGRASASVRAREQGYQYTYASSVDRLVELGVPAHRDAARALRAIHGACECSWCDAPAMTLDRDCDPACKAHRTNSVAREGV